MSFASGLGIKVKLRVNQSLLANIKTHARNDKQRGRVLNTKIKKAKHSGTHSIPSMPRFQV
eukprot:1579796-Amphidinium_carterae.1